MNIFTVLQVSAWTASILLGTWLLLDLMRTNNRYSEAVLMSSREGEIEDELMIDPSLGDSQ